VRTWLTRAIQAPRDPVWVADGRVFERWAPVSPVTGRLDAFQWRVPLADLTPPGPVIEDRRSAEVPAQIQQAPTVAAEPPVSVATHVQADDKDESGESALTPPRRSRSDQAAPAPAGDSIIPLVHVPDDPGPEPEPDVEPVGAAPPQGWRRLRSLFG
jgi:HemY protein